MADDEEKERHGGGVGGDGEEDEEEEWGEWEDEGDWEASVGSDSRWTEIGLNSFVAYCIYHYRIYYIHT